MGRVIVALLASALLAACSSAPIPLQSFASAMPAVRAYGTLSTTAQEAAVAPLLTRIAMLADRATDRLSNGRISKAQARMVLDEINGARADVEIATQAYGDQFTFDAARQSAALRLDRAAIMMEPTQ